MRKFLSLVLALVMMMSLVTINAGAKEFTDADDITYVEAVDVISTIKVMDGYEGGGFNPAGNLTRGAAAKIICNLILGPTTAAELHADTAPYRDVPVNHTFAGYIAYCQKEGIVSGYADGSFRPAGTLTGYAFMKMLLGALGYDAEIEGYVGPNWSINVAKRAIGIGLNNSLVDTFNGVDYITREEAALYAFNTLQADLVEYDTKITATVNGAEVTVGNSTAASRKWNSQQTRYDSIRKDSIVQFAEEYFNKLVLTKDMDVFGRPDREWKYDGDMIGSYINTDLLKQEYTVKVTGKDLYDLLGSTVIKDYDFEIHVDGEDTEAVLKNSTGGDSDGAWFTQENLIKSNTEEVGATGKGVLTQVFVDNDKDVEQVWISVINTYLAKATDDYNEKKDEATYKVWSIWDGDTSARVGLVKNTSETKDLTVSGEDFEIEDVKKDDIVLVHVADGEIQEFVEPEVIDETTISAFKRNSWVNAEGTQYDYDSTIQYDPDVLDNYDDNNMKETNYRIFLDEYGYAIGVEILEDPNQYVFLAGIDSKTSNLANKTAEGYVIHTDGTSATVRINMDKSRNAQNKKFSAGDEQFGLSAVSNGTGVGSLMNTWCRFTVNSDGVYTLFEVPNTDATWKNQVNGVDNIKGNTSKGKAAQGRTHSETVSAAGVELLTLDKSHIYLSSAIPTFSRVYTNDNTAFILAETDQIRATNTWDASNTKVDSSLDAVIINGVDSVTVGAQNVNMKAWDASRVKDQANPKYTANEIYVSNGVYTLFDKDGYVIAAIVVGEDDGTTTNFAFVTSSNMEQEAYSSEKDEYTWSRKVIINGEEVTLTEKGDTDPDIANISNGGEMAQGYWAEVKYDANGNVRSVTNLSTHSIAPYKMPTADFDGQYNGNNKYIDDIKDVEAATDDKSTVLLWDNLVTAGKYISVEGSTLQVRTATGAKDGFAIHPDAKTVLIQDGEPSINNMHWMDDIQYFTGGNEGAKRAVDRLEKNHVFVGFIGAVLENGRATSIIIYDKTSYSIDQGGGNGGGQDLDLPYAQRGGSSNLFDVYYYDENCTTGVVGASGMSLNQIRDLAVTEVSSLIGMTVDQASINLGGTTVTAVAQTGGLGTMVTINMHRLVGVYVDDTIRGYLDTSTGGTQDLTAANWTYLGAQNPIAGLVASGYLNGKYADTSAATITAISKAATATDVYLYTAETVTLTAPTNTTITADYTPRTGETKTAMTKTGASGSYYVAKGTALSLSATATGAGLNKRYQFTDNGVVFGQTMKLAATTDKLIGSLNAKTTTITLKDGIQIFVNGNPGIVSTSDSADWSVENLMKIAGISNSERGNYLAKLPANPATTLIADADVLATNNLATHVSAGTAPIADGDKYEFGYYKVTVATADAAITNAQTETWSLDGCTGTVTAGTAFYAKPGATIKGVYEETGTAADAKKATVTISVAGTGMASVEAEVNSAFVITKGDATDGVEVGTAASSDGTKVEIKTLKTSATADTIGAGKVTFTVTVGNADISDMKVAEDNA